MNEAIARYQQIVAADPDHELARFSLGRAYFEDGQFGLAREQFAFATARKPDWMAAQIFLGKCELALGNRTAAKSVLEHAHHLARIQNHQGPLAETRQLLASLETWNSG